MALMGTAGCTMVVAAVAMGQTRREVEPPLSDPRLGIHTLLREDLFAGFLAGDLKRMARGEKNLETLLAQRPGDKAPLLAWKAGVKVYRAILAHEAKQPDLFEKEYRQARDLFTVSKNLAPEDDGVAAVRGGVYVLFADRLPLEHRADGWATAYDAYQALWKRQQNIVGVLPLHMKGELLGGLAQSAQRTGRAPEAEQFLDRMLADLKDTPYESPAKEWKRNPGRNSNRSLACQSCHDAGRLSDRLSTLNKKP